MEKSKHVFCLALAGILSLGGIIAQETDIETFMTGTGQADRGTFCINVSGEQTFMGLQMELFLPEGMALAADNPIELGSSLANQSLRLHDYGNGHYLVLAYDLGLKATTISNEELLKCHFVLSSDMRPGVEYPVTVSGIKLAKDALHAVCPKPYEGYLFIDESGATAIHLLGQSNAVPAIYDLSGRRQAVLRQGVNIIGDRKVLTK